MPMNARLLRPRLSGDPDALRYIAAVQQADGNTLEPAIRKAITDFVVGCKQDGIWTAIKASCILMGARTLSGALTPLVGTAPTNNGPFVSGDYDRETGLIGNGSSKYIDTNRLSNEDGQNDMHVAVYQTAASSLPANDTLRTSIGAVQLSPSTVVTHIQDVRVSNTNQKNRRSRSLTTLPPATATATNNANGLQGISRSASGTFVYRAGGTDETITNTSQTQAGHDYFVLAQNNAGTAANFSDARLAFYSIGSSLTLSLLDSRVSTLYTAIGAAIP